MESEMNKWVFTDDANTQYPHAYIEGYAFGDRLLEGVWFKVTIDDQQRFHVEVDPDSEPYFDGLNKKKKWL